MKEISYNSHYINKPNTLLSYCDFFKTIPKYQISVPNDEGWIPSDAGQRFFGKLNNHYFVRANVQK